MALRIEDYAIIGDLRTVALVGRDGSIDWLCLPRLDGRACFAALLGTEENGRWLIAPEGEVVASRRGYRGDTLVLETEFQTPTGRVQIIDFMPVVEEDERADLVRLVVGIEGEVAMHTELVLRFDYGRIVPWVQRWDGGITATAGADAVRLETPIDLEGRDFKTVGRFTIRAGERVPFTLCWFRSYLNVANVSSPPAELADTEDYWRSWSARFEQKWPDRDAAIRSLLTLKALTHEPSGGIAAAATTSLPERIGGERNWDYRYCWIRDTTFTLYALLLSGYPEEANAWTGWLLRAAAGKPSQMEIMYAVDGARVESELILDWLPGYEGSRPVRIGNGAHDQLQLDVFGELFDGLHTARKHGLEVQDEGWSIQLALMEHLEEIWQKPDSGIWEVRGRPRHFTHSKVMAWVAVDRAIKAVERFGCKGPADRWRGLRSRIRETVLREGYNERRKSFVQELGGKALDGSLLMLPLVGFIAPDDPRMLSTIDAIKRELTEDGLVLRYQTDAAEDGLSGYEGTFLATSFWLADCLAMAGRTHEARELFDRLLGLRNDVGLLSEEYDSKAGRQLGNFPQAFSHVGIINTAHNLSLIKGPAEHRAE